MGTNKKKVIEKKASKKAKPIAAKKITEKATPKKTVVTKTAAKKALLKKIVAKKVVTKKNVVKKALVKKDVVIKIVVKNSAKKQIGGSSSAVPVKKPVVDKASKKVVAKKLAIPKKAIKSTKSIQPKEKAVEKKNLSIAVKSRKISTSHLKTKEMKNEDKDKISKEATPNVPKNMPLLKEEPAYLQRMMNAPKDDRTHYSKEELKEFEDIISEKLELARKQYQFAKDVLNRKNDEGTDNTIGNVKMLEDGADVLEKESFSSFAARQQRFILQLENAHARIQNGTYGVCIVTGKLIPKERLKLVPHTQHTIEAKEQRK